MPYKDPEKQRTAQKINKHKQRLERRSVLLKDKKCIDCGNDDPRVLEFHHRDPNEKESAIAAVLSSSWEKILSEVVKCDVICANCHSIRHYSPL